MDFHNCYKRNQLNRLWCELQPELGIAARDEMSSHTLDAPDYSPAGSTKSYDCDIGAQSYSFASQSLSHGRDFL